MTRTTIEMHQFCSEFFFFNFWSWRPLLKSCDLEENKTATSTYLVTKSHDVGRVHNENRAKKKMTDFGRFREVKMGWGAPPFKKGTPPHRTTSSIVCPKGRVFFHYLSHPRENSDVERNFFSHHEDLRGGLALILTHATKLVSEWRGSSLINPKKFESRPIFSCMTLVVYLGHEVFHPGS